MTESWSQKLKKNARTLLLGQMQGKCQGLVQYALYTDSNNPFDRITIYFIGSFPELETSNKYIVVIMLHFSNWTEVFVVPHYEALNIASKDVESWNLSED